MGPDSIKLYPEHETIKEMSKYFFFIQNICIMYPLCGRHNTRHQEQSEWKYELGSLFSSWGGTGGRKHLTLLG